jgi:hypothetical protein
MGNPVDKLKLYWVNLRQSFLPLFSLQRSVISGRQKNFIFSG